jgi:hypothetical protein
MVESDYWVNLEFRVCRELAGMRDNHLRFWWCDGFIPEHYCLDGPSPCIKGQAWICNGPGQERWEFALFLNHPVASRDELDWESLLPAENVTRWLALDQRGRRIQMEPSSAVPDAALSHKMDGVK